MINNIRIKSKIPLTCLERFLDLNHSGATALTSRGVNFSGISNLRRGYQIGILDNWQSHFIILTQGGEGWLKTKTQNFRLTPDTMVVVPAGNACAFAVRDDDWRILWFHLDPIDNWRNFAESGVQRLPTTMINDFSIAMEGYLRECQLDDKMCGVELYADLTALYLDRLIWSMKESSLAKVDEFRELRKLWTAVRNEPERAWDVHDMAARLNMSYSTFKRTVQRKYKVTPWRVVVDIRMDRAKLLLEKTDYPMKVIASRVGYADEFIFSTAFSKYCGACPKVWRSKYKTHGTPEAQSKTTVSPKDTKLFF